MSDYSNTNNEEMDLGELTAILWSHKFLIIIITALAVGLGGYLALTAKKKFTAVAVFQISDPTDSGLNVVGELGSLARIAGLANETSGASKSLLERIQKREFIIAVSKKNALEKDPFFNNYQTTTNSEKLGSFNDSWKSTIKKFIGLKPNKIEPDIIIEINTVAYFQHPF